MGLVELLRFTHNLIRLGTMADNIGGLIGGISGGLGRLRAPSY